MGPKGSRIPTGPKTRHTVIRNIQSALQTYLDDGHTIVLLAVSDDEFSHGEDGKTPGCRKGQMTSETGKATVMPDQTGTTLVYNTEIIQMYSLLFKCTETRTNKSRFLFAWNVEKSEKWQWYIGAPNLTNKMKDGNSVGLITQNVTKRVAKNSTKVILPALAKMTFSDDTFMWSSSGDDEKFQVVKETKNGKFFWWQTQDTGAAMLLTENVSLGGDFKFREI